MPPEVPPTLVARRRLLRSALVLAPLVAWPGLLPAAVRPETGSATSSATTGAGPRRLAFHHTHTGETLDIVYREDGAYVPEALAEIHHLFRDFRTGDVHPIDPVLLDVLHDVQNATGGSGHFEIISAYRSPATNRMLASQSSGVADHSLHLEGRAIDVRFPGVRTIDLRTAGLRLASGGVGYYPGSDFVHLDTGRVRSW